MPQGGWERILEAAPSPLFLVDEKGSIAFANQEAHSLFGYPKGMLRGKSVEILVPLRFRERHERLRTSFQHEPRDRRIGPTRELQGLRRNGSEIPITLTLKPIGFGGRRYTLAAVVDIRARREIEEKLADSEREMRLIMDHAPLIIAYVDHRRRYRFVNRRYADLFDTQASRIIGKSVRSFLGPKTYARIRPYWDRAFKGEVVNYEFRLPVPGGTRRWVQVDLVPRDLPDGSVTGVFVIAFDIHERKLGETALRTLPQRILRAQEDERRRVSRDLHDGVNQLLGAIRFQMHSAVSVAKNSDCPAGLQFMKIEGLLDKAIEEVRRVSRGLMPAELEALGLGPALESLCEEFGRDNGMPVELNLEGLPSRLTPETALHLFRICQEALSNAAKHAKATRSVVRFERLPGFLVAVVEDNGKGYSLATHANLEVALQGLGLNNMRQRAAGIGGRFEVRSFPGEGTTIRITLPMKRRRNADAPKKR